MPWERVEDVFEKDVSMKFKFPKSLSQILKSQKRLRRILEKNLLQPAIGPKKTRRPSAKKGLSEVKGFGSNPGRLSMKLYVPSRMPAKPPLVVMLHGCRQTPEGFDAASGFSALARQCGFVLLYPQQSEGNNPQRCFNWFRPSAIARDRGELMSVRQMIEFTCSRHRIDRSRIYIAGLSAGGALTSALLATYPGLFAGAAIFAGMPLGAARDAMSALRAMKSGVSRSPADWSDLVGTVSPDQKTWPPISIWHGTDDRVVNPSNARASVSQWLAVGGINEDAGRTTLKPWGELTQWKSKNGVQVSLYSLKGFGHGLPVRRSAREAQTSRSDPYVLDAGISAPLTLLRTWGLKK